MMIKRITIIIISLIMLFACCGCQLAVESKGMEPGADALCGVFITFEYLDGNEDYLDNVDWNAVMNGDETSLNNQEAQRVYAVLKDDGTSKSYFFEGIEGLRLFSVFVPGDGENEGYNTTCIDPQMLDIEVAHNVTDAGTETTLDGTLYICPQAYDSGAELTCFCNPVYQTPEGEVYMTPGTGLGTNLEAGSSISQTLSGSSTKTVNGEKQSRAGTVNLNVKGIDDIEKYVLKELDELDQVVSTLEIRKDTVPSEVTLRGHTAYAIFEKHCVDADGKTYVERSLVDMSISYIDARFINDDGFAEGNLITLKNIPA